MKKNRKNKVNFILMCVLLLTIVVTGTYAIYKMTLQGKIESDMAKVIVKPEAVTTSNLAVSNESQKSEYWFNVRNYITENSVSSINQVVCNYYMKIEGITNENVGYKLYFVDGTGKETEIVQETTGEFTGYYKAPQLLKIIDKQIDNYVIKVSLNGIASETTYNQVSIDIGYEQYDENAVDPENPDEDTKIEVANVPETTNGMIPISWDSINNYWIKADSTNADDSWYNYDNKKWANVTYVKESGINTRDYYLNAANGTKIENDDMVAMFVWIPRFVYKIPTDYYHTTLTETQILDDTNNEHLVEVHLSRGIDDYYDETLTINGHESTDINASESWITNKAFDFGGTKLTGLWIAKFMISDGTTNSTDGDVPDIYSVPAKKHEKNVLLNEMMRLCRQMELSNLYGFTPLTSSLQNDLSYSNDNNGMDTHMMTNTEWAMISYFAHSKYGVDKDPINPSMENTTDSYAGGSSNIDTVYGSYSSQTTTGNIYGIYDMESIIWNSVAAKVSSETGASIVFESALPKYKDVYVTPAGISYVIDINTQTSIYGVFQYINGAAIWEISSAVGTGTSSNSISGWYSARTNIGTKSNMFLCRGGSYTISGNTPHCSIFSFGNMNGNDKATSRSFRPTMAVANGI